MFARMSGWSGGAVLLLWVVLMGLVLIFAQPVTAIDLIGM